MCLPAHRAVHTSMSSKAREVAAVTVWAMSETAELRERVRQAIVRGGLSQKEFARRADIEVTKLSKSLHGTRRFTPAELARIAEVAEVSVGWLVNGTGPAPTEPLPAGRAEEGAQGGPPAATGRRQAIIEAAVRMIAERGYHATRVSDIAAACGTSTATIHYYFPERASLLQAALRYCVDQAVARRYARMHAAADAREQLLQLVRLQTPADPPHRLEWAVWLQVWAEAARHPEIRRIHREFYAGWHETVVEIVRRGVAEGVFHSELDPELVALRLTSLIDGLAIQVLTDPSDSFVEPMRLLLADFVERELSRPPGQVRVKSG